MGFAERQPSRGELRRRRRYHHGAPGNLGAPRPLAHNSSRASNARAPQRPHDRTVGLVLGRAPKAQAEQAPPSGSARRGSVGRLTRCERPRTGSDPGRQATSTRGTRSARRPCAARRTIPDGSGDSRPLDGATRLHRRSLPGPASGFLHVRLVRCSRAGATEPSWKGADMTETLPIIVLGLLLGMRHATDPDHVIAVTTIVSRQATPWGAALIGTLWGIGHTVTITLVGGAIILFGLVIQRLHGARRREGNESRRHSSPHWPSPSHSAPSTRWSPATGRRLSGPISSGPAEARGMPVLLGLIVTASHTAGVYLLGAVTLYASRYIVPDRLYPWLGATSGLVIAILGFVLFLRRYAGLTSGHAHGHSHRHGHGHALPQSPGPGESFTRVRSRPRRSLPPPSRS